MPSRVESIKKKYKEALPYHIGGKLKVVPSKKLHSRYDLSLAYTPGVAVPCVEIEQNPELAFEYTLKGNLVAVISNGTAVLGLGDIGALASKPVMEGKAVLFKNFANIDSFDIEVDQKDPDKFIETVRAISPTFGGINLEDIKSPECFYIEEKLIELCDIPVMHDDQHGTAVITTAGLINALEITGKKLKNLKVVVIGAGAAAIASAKLYRFFGVEDITLFDSIGCVHKKRSDLNSYKSDFSASKDMSIEEALNGADMVLGLAKANIITPKMLKKMAKEPLIFALSNPIPEIMPDIAKEARSDAIIATGRSDFANQINNALGFPYIFRGALDCRAKKINNEMKVAAAKALAKLAKLEVPEGLKDMYGKDFSFGREYIVPLPFDRRLLPIVSSAVLEAAESSGVARKKVDVSAYKKRLEKCEYCGEI